MRLLSLWLLLISIILYLFYYVNLNLEKTIAVNDLIKLSEDTDKIYYSAENNADENDVIDLGLIKQSEVVYVSGHKLLVNDTKDNTLDLFIDRPDKNVILVLNSKEKITWNIESSSNTNIQLVVYDGPESNVLSKNKIFKYKIKLEFTLEKENISFIKLLNSVNKLTTINKFSYFYVKKELPSYIKIDSIQNDKKLSLDYLKAKKLDLNIDFQLISESNDIIDFDLYGPKLKNLETKKILQNSVLSPDKSKLYKIMENGISIIDLNTKQVTNKPIPIIKKLHNPRGLAYDSLSDMLYLANKVGKFYVFDVEKERWIAIRKYIKDFDINSFSYDAISNIYVASSWKKVGLIFFDQQGNFSTKHDLKDKLHGLSYHYKKNHEIPRLYIIPKGDGIVVVYIKDFVQKIWYYDKLKREAYLTYNFFNS